MLGAIGASALKIAISLATSLITEAFLKKALIIGLEQLVKRTETDADDRLLQAAKEAWGQK